MKIGLFKSANKPSLIRGIASFFWPRGGFRRAWTCQFLRLARLKACPHKISLGFAAGAFASFLPLVGLHFILAAALAFAVRGNIIASAVGTVVGNPLTFPMIWFATYKVGLTLTGQLDAQGSGSVAIPIDLQSAFDPTAFTGVFHKIGEAFVPMLVGALPLGFFCAAGCYLLIYCSLRSVRNRSSSADRSCVS